jgi:CRP-like cAMP-binding protein
MHSSSHEDELSRRAAVLKNVSIFAELGDADLRDLIVDLRLKEYDKDEVVFRHGDSSRELYIILAGKVRIFLMSPSGGETSINIFSAYDVFGEFAALDNRPRSGTAKTIVPSTLLAITQEKFLQHMRQKPDLALGLIRLLVSKARWTAAYAEAVAQYDAAGRLLHILLLYNEKFGEEIEPGRLYELDLALNQTDLASLVGARREWVNRLLRDWRKRGLISYESGKIIILDLPRVQQERDNRIEVSRTKW